MKKIVTLLAAAVTLCTAKVNAQSFTMTSDTVTMNLVGGVGSGITTLDDYVASVTGAVTLHWHVIYSDFPTSWKGACGICDNNLCYTLNSLWPSGTYKTSSPYTSAGVHDFHMQINQSGLTGGGCHYTTVQLTNEGATPSPDSTTATFKICRDATGVNDVNNVFSSVKVYPNPAANQAQLSFTLTETSEVAMGVYDLAGRMVYVQPVTTMNAGVKTLTIPVGDLAAGIYHVVLTAGDNNVVQKFTVTK